MRIPKPLLKFAVVYLLICGVHQAKAQNDCRNLFPIEQEVEELLSAGSDLSSDPTLNEEFLDLLDFEKRVLHFLKQAPPSIFEAIGNNFAGAVTVDRSRKNSAFGLSNVELSRRENVLKYSRTSMFDQDWQVVSEFFADPELYRFLATALLGLPLGTNPARTASTLTQLRVYALTYLQKYEKQMPPVELMLKASLENRTAFMKVARMRDKHFKLDLTLEKNQKAAAKMLREKKFGNEKNFLVLWLIEAYVLAHQAAKSKEGSLAEFFNKSVEDQIEASLIKDEDSITDPAVFYFMERWTFSVSYSNPIYSREEVKAAFVRALEEHHSLLKTMITESRELKSYEAENPEFAFEYVHRFDYEPCDSPAVDQDRLESYISGAVSIDQLQADRDYRIAFTRERGLRRKTFIARFTPRGLAELREWHSKKFHGFDAVNWLKALQRGFAAAQGENGLKLLKTSPIKALPHLELEIKIVGPGERWLGYIDEEGRYVFDLFYDLHS